MATTTCEIVTVVVTDEDGDQAKFTVPAYTRSPMDMQVVLEGLVAEYMQRSLDVREPVSLGDFAMYALTAASKEPRVC